MSALNTVDGLRLAATLGSAIATGLMISFSVITVPMLEAPEPGLTPFQRWRLWRKGFERGQATIPTFIAPNIVMLGMAAYLAEAGERRNLLVAATAALAGVPLITPVIMLGAGLRAELLDSVKTKEDEERAKTWVTRFQLFHSARIAFGLIATILAGYELLL